MTAFVQPDPPGHGLLRGLESSAEGGEVDGLGAVVAKVVVVFVALNQGGERQEEAAAGEEEELSGGHRSTFLALSLRISKSQVQV